MNYKQAEKNGIIVALFLFQYSLLIPLMRYYSPSLLVSISGSLLMAAVFIVNKKIIINIKAMCVIVALLLIMIIKTYIDNTQWRVIVLFLFISIPAVVILSFPFDHVSFLKASYKLSLINFLILVFLPFTKGRISYMRFGYGMVLSVIFSYLIIFRRKTSFTDDKQKKSIWTNKIVGIVVFVVSTLEMIVFGSRGVLIVFAAFVAIDVLLIYRTKLIKNSILIAAGTFVIFNLERILSLLIKLAARFGVRSYSLRKYQYQLAVGIEEASSGRAKLFQAALSTIRKYPLFGTKMIIYDADSLYVHNIFLQVGRDMGLIMMLISIAFVIACICILLSKKIETDEKTVIAIFFCVSVIRLLVSSNLWERPEFWALVCIVLNYQTIFRRKDENVLLAA